MNQQHPNVNWDSVGTRRGRTMVEVTCPTCETPRMVDASTVRQQLEWGRFTGRCKKHRRVATAFAAPVGA